MQESRRPRRTSELHEEPGTATKRQSRIPRGTLTTAPSPAQFGTAQKLSVRGNSSATRSSTARRTGVTPNKVTPTPARALFSAGKQTGGNNVHNKKWIQDQTLRITEYLKNAWTPAAMPGITEDFLSRSNCLKQMSIKQFVAIINYFLHFISGNRFTVGSNHVDDIVNILRKLDYPHQVSKSWLITPNTTHSFGNVILLLDFLMDFAPNNEEMTFPLQEIEENTTNTNRCNKEFDFDLEFKAKFLQNYLESYYMWDSKLVDEFEKIKRQTADLYVRKRCGINGIDFLDAEIERLNQLYEDVRNQRPHIELQDEELCKQLNTKLTKTIKKYNNLRDNFKQDIKQLEQMNKNKNNLQADITRLQKKNSELQTGIHKQIINVQQLVKFTGDVEHLRVLLQTYERSLDDLKQREHQQTEELSIIWQTVTGEIEQINLQLRDLINELQVTNSKHYYQIPLNADVQDIENLMEFLRIHGNQMECKLQTAKQQLKKIDSEIDIITNDIVTNIEPQSLAKDRLIENVKKSLQQLEYKIKNDSKNLFAQYQTLEVQLNEINNKIDDVRKEIVSNEKELEQIIKENEDNLSKAEHDHKKFISERRSFLTEYEIGIKECMKELENVQKLIDSKTEIEKERDN